MVVVKDCGKSYLVKNSIDSLGWFSILATLRFFFSFIRAKRPVMMPGYHYVDRKLDVTSHNKDYTSIEQCEISIARQPVLAWLLFRVKLRQKYAVA